MRFRLAALFVGFALLAAVPVEAQDERDTRTCCSCWAISRPKASAVRSTCLAPSLTPASSESSSLPSWKLTRAPTVPTIRGDGRRQRAAFETQPPVARAEACLTVGTVVIRPLQARRSEHGLEAFGPTTRVASRLTAGAGCRGTDVVGEIGIEPPLHCPRRQLEGSPAHGRLQGLEVERLDRFRAD